MVPQNAKSAQLEISQRCQILRKEKGLIEKISFFTPFQPILSFPEFLESWRINVLLPFSPSPDHDKFLQKPLTPSPIPLHPKLPHTSICIGGKIEQEKQFFNIQLPHHISNKNLVFRPLPTKIFVFCHVECMICIVSPNFTRLSFQEN